MDECSNYILSEINFEHDLFLYRNSHREVIVDDSVKCVLNNDDWFETEIC